MLKQPFIKNLITNFSSIFCSRGLFAENPSTILACGIKTTHFDSNIQIKTLENSAEEAEFSEAIPYYYNMGSKERNPVDLHDHFKINHKASDFQVSESDDENYLHCKYNDVENIYILYDLKPRFNIMNSSNNNVLAWANDLQKESEYNSTNLQHNISKKKTNMLSEDPGQLIKFRNESDRRLKCPIYSREEIILSNEFNTFPNFPQTFDCVHHYNIKTEPLMNAPPFEISGSNLSDIRKKGETQNLFSGEAIISFGFSETENHNKLTQQIGTENILDESSFINPKIPYLDTITKTGKKEKYIPKSNIMESEY